jgi:hypothetical protein
MLVERAMDNNDRRLLRLFTKRVGLACGTSGTRGQS